MLNVNLDYIQIASGHFLTDYLPDNHLEMEHDALIKFAEDNAYCFLAGYSGESIWEEIDSLAHTLEAISHLSIIEANKKGRIRNKRSVTHNDPNGKEPVRVDYVDVTFKAEDWKELGN